MIHIRGKGNEMIHFISISKAGPVPGCAGPKADPVGRGPSTYHGHGLLQCYIRYKLIMNTLLMK